MKLKRFTAPTMPEAIKMIKNDLGEDAVILSTRKITGAGGQKGLEITAAIEQVAPKPAPEAPPPSSAIEDAMRAAQGQTPSEVSALTARLIEHGVDTALAQRINKAVTALRETGFNEEEGLEMVLSKMINFTQPADVLQKDRPLVLVGPTGAGKTTTLAKIAVSERMQGQKVALVSMDTYKIGGIEQLGIYADALKENLHVVDARTRLADVRKELDSYDLTLVDCAGTNPREKTRLQDVINQMVDVKADVALVIPCNLNAAEMKALPKAFGALEPAHLIFSKLDETAFLGGLVNTAVGSGLPVCFVTDGQRVPQDLLQIDPKSLSRRLLAKPLMPWEDV